ncbi:hypothetical protein BGZ60DRAFT_530972 [Tricladium varicosporioides]|nr:hypothetical protein BGZ60DRAFT_530972 [Hymenoscyphus varicosporioides]
MKAQSLSSIIALATGLQVAAATGFGSSGSFSCPANTNNQCNDDQSNGFDWKPVPVGSISGFGGFKFSGYSCANQFGSGKRDRFEKRTFANSKCITGSASSDKSKSPSFSCDQSSVKQFSVNEFHVSVEFDCDLEFHYGMPDGSTCKQTHGCSTAGTIVKNSQCGGATGVTVVYPSQSKTKSAGPAPTKSSCSIGIHSIGFDCSSASKTTVRSTTTSATKPTTSATKPGSSAATTTSVSQPSTLISKTTSESKTESTTSKNVGVTSSTSVPETKPATTPASSASSSETTPVVVSSTTPVLLTTSTIFTTSVQTVTSCGPTVTNCPAGSTVLTTVTIPLSTTVCPVSSAATTPAAPSSSSVVVGSSSSVVVPSSSAVVPSSSVPSGAASSTTVPSSAAPSSSAPSTSTGNSGSVTSVPSAPSSSVISTVPAASGSVTTVIIISSETICPVTATSVVGSVTSVSTGVSTSTILSTITSTVCTKCAAVTTPVPTSSANSGASTTKPSGPATTAPCPDVLPKCMNTWNFIVGCIDNTDSNCYCPSADFVNNVFSCLTAYGASNTEISAAASYFQGICAPHIPSNPAIITGCPSVAVPTATTSANSGAVTSAPVIPVTTINILTTIVVPCIQTTGVSSGYVIPSSSTTSVLSTAVTVPQVVFSTPAGATTAAPSLVVGTPAAITAPTYVPVASTVPSTTSANNGTVKATPSSTPLVSNSGSRTGVAIGSIFAVVLAAFAL